MARSPTKRDLLQDGMYIFIAPQRIQKKRYQDLKNAAKKRQFQICDNLSPEVTHVVTEFESQEQLLRCLRLREVELSSACELLSLSWFVESIKAGRPVDVADRHRLKRETEVEHQQEGSAEVGKQGPCVAEWACQRVTCLQHHNHRFTEALETVERHAELRDSDQDYSRALAFRRAANVLKSLPFPVTSMAQIRDLKDLGVHSKKIIKDILEEGVSEEVELIRQDDWFHLMKEFTSVFGVGPSTAKKWIERGWRDVDEARRQVDTSDWRVTWGLAFHRDLTTAVTRHEADFILDLVTRELRELLPGAIVTLTGGFRRGKPRGHDVDLLISHPEEGHEHGVLARLLTRLEVHGALLCGNLERSTYSPDALVRDFKLSMRGQLDHFEKWLGIIRVNQGQLDSKGKNQVEADSAQNTESPSRAEVSDTGSKCSLTESLDGGDDVSSAKRQKLSTEGLAPLQLAQTNRDWLARRVDLIVTPYSQYYYALVGWTGSKHFNRDLRLYAAKKFDRKLTSHGLFDQAMNESLPASSEKEVFDHLQLEYREPWQRNC